MKILLVKLKHIGDTLLLTPAIRFLRDRYPDATIDVVVRKGCEKILEGNPDITNIIPIASPEKHKRSGLESAREFIRAFKTVFNKRYDYAFDLSNSDRAKFLILLSNSKTRSINDWQRNLGYKRYLFNTFTYFNWPGEHQVLKDFRAVADLIEPTATPGPLSINADIDAGLLREKLPFLEGIGRYALIHPVSRWTFKQWLPERWAEVADWLKNTCGCDVVFSSGPNEKESDHVRKIMSYAHAGHHATQGKISIRELACLSKNAALFLGVDTAAMHVAAAVQTKSVVLFGPSSGVSWRPWQCRHELVLGECACMAAGKFTCDKGRPYPCMEKITVREVQEAARRLMDAPLVKKGRAV